MRKEQMEHSACFRFHGSLNDFLRPAQKATEIVYPFGGLPAVKDAIEAIGVPHPEVGALTINSLVPVIETGAGVVHIYVEKDAALQKAVDIVVNAKVSRPSVCNAVDTVLVDNAIAPRFLEQLQERFRQHSVEIFADSTAAELLQGYPHLQQATTEDFGREFLDLKCAVKVVRNIDEALEHIQEFSTRHSEAIVSENKEACNRFIREVDAAAVYANASTRFTDGEEFGLGAEIGISTQKLHARGPFALEKLVTEKWIIQGEGQIR